MSRCISTTSICLVSLLGLAQAQPANADAPQAPVAPSAAAGAAPAPSTAAPAPSTAAPTSPAEAKAPTPQSPAPKSGAKTANATDAQAMAPQSPAPKPAASGAAASDAKAPGESAPATTAPATSFQPGSIIVPPDVIRPQIGRDRTGAPAPAPSPVAHDVVTEEPKQEPPADLQHLGDFQNHWQVSLGVRVAWLSDPNFDPFSDRDTLTEVGAGAARTVLARGRFSLAAAAFVDVGGTDSTVRGAASKLHLERIALGPEARMHWIPRSYLFVRILPLYTRASAQLKDEATDTTLKDTADAFGAEASGGLAFNFFGSDAGSHQQARFWLIGEGGYGVGKLDAFRLSAKGDDSAPARFDPVSFGSLSLAGPFARVSAAATF